MPTSKDAKWAKRTFKPCPEPSHPTNMAESFPSYPAAAAPAGGDRAPAEPSNRVYAGNLAFGLTDDSLREAFVAFGATEAKIISDRDTGE